MLHRTCHCPRMIWCCKPCLEMQPALLHQVQISSPLLQLQSGTSCRMHLRNSALSKLQHQHRSCFVYRVRRSLNQLILPLGTPTYSRPRHKTSPTAWQTFRPEIKPLPVCCSSQISWSNPWSTMSHQVVVDLAGCTDSSNPDSSHCRLAGFTSQWLPGGRHTNWGVQASAPCQALWHCSIPTNIPTRLAACRVCYLGISARGVASPPMLRPMLHKASDCESSTSSSSSSNRSSNSSSSSSSSSSAVPL